MRKKQKGAEHAKNGNRLNCSVNATRSSRDYKGTASHVSESTKESGCRKTTTQGQKFAQRGVNGCRSTGNTTEKGHERGIEDCASNVLVSTEARPLSALAAKRIPMSFLRSITSTTMARRNVGTAHGVRAARSCTACYGREVFLKVIKCSVTTVI
jgi:hypothetical protein